VPGAKTLNVIGCGRVGRTLCRLWHAEGVFRIGSVLNRSPESARKAVEFIGAGTPVEHYSRLEPADAVMITTPDEVIADCCRRLCEAPEPGPGRVAFHCSGSLASGVLEPARRRGAAVASAHPLRSFADPALAVHAFAGTPAAVEGDAAACALLEDALARLGALVFPIDPEAKTLYHAATVAISNYLVALCEVALRCLEKSGIDRPTATRMIGPILGGTVENVLELGPVRALTGPIARGELSVVERHRRALGEWDKNLEAVYRSLGLVAVELAAAQGHAPPDALAAIRRALET